MFSEGCFGRTVATGLKRVERKQENQLEGHQNHQARHDGDLVRRWKSEDREFILEKEASRGKENRSPSGFGNPHILNAPCDLSLSLNICSTIQPLSPGRFLYLHTESLQPQFPLLDWHLTGPLCVLMPG